MKRNGLVLFLVALLVFPAMALTFTSCAKQEVKTEKVGLTDEELAAQRKAERDAKAKADEEMRRKAAEEAARKEKMRKAEEDRMRAIELGKRGIFENQNVHFDFDKYNIRVGCGVRPAGQSRIHENESQYPC